MENKKQAIILSVVAIVALLSLILGATFAYFRASGNSGSSTNVNVTTYTSDLLTFEIGDDIAVYANQTSFASGKGNATGSTFAKAILTANNKTNEATKNYYVYLNISENTFTYTQNESTPELLLTIKDTSGNEITSITSLTYKTVTDGKGASISGFDITTKSGVITLFDNREITATPTKTEEWNITVTFVNYNANQTGNAGKSFNAKLIIQQESQSNQTLLADYVISQYTGTQGENSLYYHNSSLTNGAGDNSYRYAGASESVNNFVCFGSTINPCPTDNLYRIIGVIDGKVKLIKYDYASRNLLGTTGEIPYHNSPSSNYQGTLTDIDIYHISSPGINDWSESPLNQTNLNTSFINNIGTTWASKIITTTWKVGGGAQTNIMQSVPKIAYQYEVGSNASSTTYAAKIGLMYVSDYYFAAGPSAWTLVGHNSDSTKDYRIAKTINWMYMGFDEWTLTPSTNDSESTFGIYNDGSVASGFVSIDMYGVRPVFNLDTSVTYVSGDGTKSSPIIIN